MLLEQRGKELCELQRQKSSNKKKGKKRPKKPMQSIVQQLFKTCKELTAAREDGAVPSPQDVERLRLVLDRLKPEDFGLTEDMPYFRKIEKKGAPPVTYLHIYESNKFTIGIFCLPPSAVIPLHNHPGMTVFSKILLGSMHIKSYDWVMNAFEDGKENVNPPQILGVKPPGTRLAKVIANSVFTAPCDTSILYPASGGNMHCFEAVTSCAFLDIMVPPYSEDCTYYKEVPSANLSSDLVPVPENGNEKYAWLEEVKMPADFRVVGAIYRGPEV